MRACRMSVPALLVFAMNACAFIHPHPLASRDEPVRGKVITEEMIAQTNASTAWDVLQQSGFYRMISDAGSGTSGIHSRRGRTSLLLPGSDVPRLIVDGARVSDINMLHQISAGSIAWIELLGGLSGAAEEGTNSGGGVIRVVSKAGK